MKKLISFVLTTLLLFSYTLPTYATDSREALTPAEIAKFFADLEDEYGVNVSVDDTYISALTNEHLVAIEAEASNMQQTLVKNNNSTQFVILGRDENRSPTVARGGPYYERIPHEYSFGTTTNVIVYYVSWGSVGWYDGYVVDAYFGGLSTATATLLGGEVVIENDFDNFCSYYVTADVKINWKVTIVGIPVHYNMDDTWTGVINLELPPT